MSAVDPTETYHTLDGAGAAVPVPLTPTFWQDLMDGSVQLPGGWLMMASEVTQDMGHWEMHPNGEEVLICLSGALAVLEETEQGDRTSELPAGRVYNVLRGTWHRILMRTPGRIIHITWGEGTEHRAL